jgi:predicted nucleic acid-binding protein
MATTAADAIFVDTNPLVYSKVISSPFHSDALRRLTNYRNSGKELWFSRQIIREYISVMSRPNAFPITPTRAGILQDIQDFQSTFLIAEDGSNVTDKLLDLFSSSNFGGKQIHDANIVATMQAYNIPNLLTHNVADFQRFSSLITILPLVP